MAKLLALPIPEQFIYVDSPHYLKCVICQDVMKMPVSLQCGHSFCDTCCQRSLECKRECPSCRKEVLQSSAHPNYSLRQALDDQMVYCRNGLRRKDFTAHPIFEINLAGCDKVVKRSEALAHEKECPFRWVLCGLHDPQRDEECRVLCRDNEAAEHRRGCDFKLVSCPNEGCDEQISIRSFEKHKESCLMETVTCPNDGCSERLLRKTLRTHQEQCAYRIIICDFHKFGCMEQGNITAMEEHKRNACHEHLVLVCGALHLLEHKGSQGRKINCARKKFRCVVHNFDRLAKKQVIDVDLDASWKLKIWPNGEDKRHKGYVSIRLFSREASPGFRVEGPYTLRVVNQGDAAKNIVKQTEASSREWADAVRGWGFPAFAKVDEVLDTDFGFLKDGCLVVEVEVCAQSILEIIDYNEDE
eukprot:NODE_1561_length_1494_cov_35.323183_g1408_i0.p1 GENE.NODE_1561_length_1494_cov_35.323183_g1408_i0~~NODE_1561_length_1494_cov_35.323183_g1408_i0.p1  ORF type:complete len:447 (-),score=85.94 NODE_1561_length_1494_cov_35.323183_g1408_i0:154-1398(-)